MSSPFSRYIGKNHKLAVAIFSLEWIFIISSGIFSYLYMGKWIQNMINQSLVTSPQSDLFEMWKNPPVQPILSVYLFNYTNTELWLDGTDEKLIVEEVGPYCYQEVWQKKNVQVQISQNEDIEMSIRLQKVLN